MYDVESGQDLADVRDEIKRLKLVKDRYSRAISGQKHAKIRRQTDFAFESGHQYTQDEIDILEEEGRPDLTYNLCKNQVSLLRGAAEENRMLVKAMPVDETSDQFLCDVQNDAADWFEEQANSRDAEDDAFELATIGGEGFVAMDIMQDPDRPFAAKIDIKNIHPHEITYDPNDEWVFWERWVTRETFKVMYPQYARKLDSILRQSYDGDVRSLITDKDPGDVFSTMEVSSEYDEEEYNFPLDEDYYDRGKEEIRIVHYEYYEAQNRYYGWLVGMDPWVDEPVEFDEEDLEQHKQEFEEAHGMEFEYWTVPDKRVRLVQFTGNFVLYDDVSPMPFKGFSIIPCFAYTDWSKKIPEHYGLVRLLQDPQKEVNKRWSHVLNILTNQGNGLLAELDAFVDKEMAESDWNDPTRIKWLNKGGLEKIREMSPVEFPQGSLMLHQAATELMKQIGVSSELLGVSSNKEDPGIVVRMRQVQGMLLFKPLFRNWYKMIRGIRRRIHEIITSDYVPDSQLLKILGSNDKYQIQGDIILNVEKDFNANIRDIKSLKYDLRMEESPANMSKVMYELAVMLQMQQAGIPVDPKVLIEKLDLAADEKQRWFEFIDMQQQQQQQAAQAEQQRMEQWMQAQIQAEQQKNQTQLAKVQSDAQAKQAQIQADAQKQGMESQARAFEMQQKAKEAEQKGKLDTAKLQSQLMKDQTESQLDAARFNLDTEKAMVDTNFRKAQSEMDEFDTLHDAKMDEAEQRRKKSKDKWDTVVELLKMDAEERKMLMDMIQRYTEVDKVDADGNRVHMTEVARE